MGTYVITEPCIGVKDGSCVEVCPVACIHTVTEASQFFIDPDICIECEQCVIVCPVDAIYVDTEVPEKWKSSIEENARFFREMKPPSVPISLELATEMIGATEAYARSCGVALSIVIVDQAGEVVVERQMDGAETEAIAAALTSARKAASTGVRSPGAHAVFDGLEVVGGMGAAGGAPEENSLAVRAGIAAGSDAVEHS